MKKYLNSNITGIDNTYFIRSGFWVVLRQTVMSALGLLLSIILTHKVSKETFGNYQLVLSIIAVLSIVSLPGLGHAISRAAPLGFDGNYKEAVKQTLVRSLLGIAVLILIGLLFISNGNKEVGLAVIVISFLFPLQESMNLWDVFLSSKERYRKVALMGIFSSLFITGSTLLALFWSQGNLLMILAGFLISSALTNILNTVVSFNHVENDKKEKGFFQFGVFMTKITFLQLIASYGDKIVLGIFVSPATLAVYIIATSIILSIQNALKSISVIITPRLVRLKELSVRIWVISFLLGLGISIGVFIFIEMVMNYLYPDSYSDAVELGRYASLSLIFFITNLLYQRLLVVHKKTKVLTVFNLIKNPVIWAIQISLFLFMGVKGLVIAFALNQLIILIITFSADKYFKNSR